MVSKAGGPSESFGVPKLVAWEYTDILGLLG